MNNPLFATEFAQGTFSVYKEPNLPPQPFYQVKQVHGTQIINPLAHHRPEDFLSVEADALLIFYNDYSSLDYPALAIRTADCLPVLVFGKKGYALLHLGWRGVAQGLFTRLKDFSLEPLKVFIGPSIHECCYEVQESFRAHFPQSPHFKARQGKLFFNLQSELIDQIHHVFPQLKIEDSCICTCCCTEYFSYRRNSTPLRNYNIFSPTKILL